MKALVETGADVHAKDKYRYGRPLHRGRSTLRLSRMVRCGLVLATQEEGAAPCLREGLCDAGEGAVGKGRGRARQGLPRVRSAAASPASLTRAFSWHSSRYGSSHICMIVAGVCRLCSQTALDVALRNGHTETVKALVGSGADVHAKDQHGYGRPLHRLHLVFASDGAMRARAGCAGGRHCTMPQRRLLWSW